MTADALVYLIPCLFTLAVILGLVTWNRLHPVSFWLVVGYPRKAVSVYLTWGIRGRVRPDDQAAPLAVDF